MSLLFEKSPIEDQDGKKSARARKKVAPPPVVSEEPEKQPLYTRPIRALLPLGKLDEGVECSDSRCGTSCHDILMEDRGEWLLQCCYCNCTQWVPVIKGHLPAREEQFIFRDGRFAGLSIDEAVAQPRGRDYVEWAAKSHKRPAVQAACKDWLDRFGKAL